MSTAPFHRMLGVPLVSLAALVALPVGSAAQGGAATDAARAHAWHAQALELQGDVRKYGAAARLHLKSAEARTPDDRGAVECLLTAARLLAYANRAAEARVVMERAAARALDIGEIDDASIAFLQAAYLARQEDAEADVHRLVRRTQLLSTAPLLSAQVRLMIQERLQGWPTLATVR